MLKYFLLLLSGKVKEMNKMNKLGIVLIIMALAGCTANPPKQEIKIGILPIEDALPIVVAEQEGIFSKHGLNVEIIKFQSALERDSALTANELHAVITDPVAVILLGEAGYNMKIVSLCLGKTPEEGVFAILASPNSSISSVKDLEGGKIAISSNTIIEYVTDSLLKEYNVNAEKIEVKKIPIRMQMLLDDKVEAATLPEPLASLAVHKGAKLIVSDAMLNKSISQTVIAFREDFIRENPQAIEKFLQAYKEAVEKINSQPSKYRSLFIEIARVPEPIANSYPMPTYPEPEPLGKENFLSVYEWAKNKGLIKKEISYEDIIYD